MKVKTVEDLKQLPESDLVINYIIDRWKKGLYTLILIGGLPGSGKSSTCIRLAELIQEKITGENNLGVEDIADNFLDFIKFVKDANPQKVCTGIVEEVSVLFPSRRAMSSDNVDVAKILDTCRKKKVILFANAPVWTSIDSHMRTMANVYIQTIKVYKKAGIVYSKCYKIQTNPQTGKTYTHNFKRNKKDVNRMYTKHASKEIWFNYENKKDLFLDELYSKTEARALSKQNKEDKLLNKNKPNKISQRDMEIYVRKSMGEKESDIAKDFDLTRERINQIYHDIYKNEAISLGKSSLVSKNHNSETNKVT